MSPLPWPPIVYWVLNGNITVVGQAWQCLAVDPRVCTGVTADWRYKVADLAFAREKEVSEEGATQHMTQVSTTLDQALKVEHNVTMSMSVASCTMLTA